MYVSVFIFLSPYISLYRNLSSCKSSNDHIKLNLLDRILLRVKWHSGDIDILCGIFKECEPGYHGTNCSLTCPEHYYGRLCLEPCDCDSDKYCDSSVGCLCKNNSVNCTDQRWVCISLYSYSV